jgi:phytoene synthase
MFAPELSFVAQAVRQSDRDRFGTALLAPADRREALFALYAFNVEIAAVAERVSEALLGRMRLQWWRETLNAVYDGRPVAHPVAEALRQAVSQQQPSRRLFDRLIDAREADLTGTPPADLAALEAYAEGTAATVTMLAVEILGAGDGAALPAARQVGLAWGLTGILRAVRFHASAGRLFLPTALLAEHGVAGEDVLAGRSSAGLAAAGRRIAARAREHLAGARAHQTDLPRAALPGLLTGPLTERYLDRLAAAGGDLMDPGWSVVRPRPALLAWHLWRRRF